jgi:hypothetical protein
MNSDTIKNPVENCGVDEEMFPCMGKCCRKKQMPVFMVSYEKICPYCDISSFSSVWSKPEDNDYF